MRLFVRTALAGAIGLSAGASAQIGKLYMQDAQPYQVFNNQVRVAQAGSVVQTFNLNGPYEHNMVVAGDIRTYGGDYAGQPGYQYDLNGNFQGPQYNDVGGAYYGGDATTDGQNYNWIYDYGYGAVYRYDRNYQNPTYAFGYQSNLGGITYDKSDGTLWLLETWSGDLRHVDQGGNTINTYYDGAISQGGYSALAMDVDGSLWALQGNGSGSNYIVYNKQGQQISSGSFGYSDFTGSAEFDMNAVPAPGAAALLGLGGLAATRRRRA